MVLVETFERLKSKHPHQSEGVPPSPTVDCPMIDSKKSVFMEALRRVPKGLSGAGPSGWRYEHLHLLLPLLTCNLLFGVCCHIAKDHLSSE